MKPGNDLGRAGLFLSAGRMGRVRRETDRFPPPCPFWRSSSARSRLKS